MASQTSTPPSNPTTTSKLPNIHLLCMQASSAQAFHTAVATHFPTLSSHTTITHHECSLKFLPKHITFTAIVSPANSYARLDGAFDDALARAYMPNKEDYGWITRKAQAVVYREHRGFAPPGTCTIIRLDHSQPGDAPSKNPWKSSYLLLCPTMRVPQNVTWDREVVYECIWSLLCAVDRHNRAVRGNSSSSSSSSGIETEITSLLMTPLATGVGGVSEKRWAEQCVLAMKHWVEAVEHPEVWAQTEWRDVREKRDGEIKATWRGEGR
ncbi:uncharacterized protein RCC_01542 [Ramularia collo-cygni]|uniref:Macro domain-like protein n=1 Tax=Ramularia collo-cygni TaxID=112498 RepID=A0A2D3UPC6_9PEZI|nr:uncharacterized protein RCC_01542 [Ramularia collo-cygni]CZT15708.1 uncharacterized protein RCC_01542 [Ramularia collo-cygni]